jgi:hypothetical protein
MAKQITRQVTLWETHWFSSNPEVPRTDRSSLQSGIQNVLTNVTGAKIELLPGWSG